MFRNRPLIGPNIHRKQWVFKNSYITFATGYWAWSMFLLVKNFLRIWPRADFQTDIMFFQRLWPQEGATLPSRAARTRPKASSSRPTDSGRRWTEMSANRPLASRRPTATPAWVSSFYSCWKCKSGVQNLQRTKYILYGPTEWKEWKDWSRIEWDSDRNFRYLGRGRHAKGRIQLRSMTRP